MTDYEIPQVLPQQFDYLVSKREEIVSGIQAEILEQGFDTGLIIDELGTYDLEYDAGAGKLIFVNNRVPVKAPNLFAPVFVQVAMKYLEQAGHKPAALGKK